MKKEIYFIKNKEKKLLNIKYFNDNDNILNDLKNFYKNNFNLLELEKTNIKDLIILNENKKCIIVYNFYKNYYNIYKDLDNITFNLLSNFLLTEFKNYKKDLISNNNYNNFFYDYNNKIITN